MVRKLPGEKCSAPPRISASASKHVARERRREQSDLRTSVRGVGWPSLPPVRRNSTKSSGRPGGAHAGDRSVDVVRHAYVLHVRQGAAEVEEHVAGAPVAILRAADAAGVHEVDAVDDRDATACACGRTRSRRPASAPTALPSSGRTRRSDPPSSRRCSASACRARARVVGPGDVAAERAEVDAERQARRGSASSRRTSLASRRTIAEVRSSSWRGSSYRQPQCL